ncbi:uncharacterized protein VP01_10729g1, partial [Puccinia sorghi]
QQPSLQPPNSTILHRLLQSVPKLEQALSGTLLRPINLRDENLNLSEVEDMLLKMALNSTIDDGIKVGVAECKTGLDGFQLISDTFTLRTQTAHLAIVRDLLDLCFNHHDKSAHLDSHFHKVENLVKQLTRSDFQVTEESLTGIFFQLSLPNTETYPREIIKLRTLIFCKLRRRSYQSGVVVILFFTHIIASNLQGLRKSLKGPQNQDQKLKLSQ